MKNKIKKETLWSFATKGITFILFFSINIFLARKLGPDQFGLWSFFLSIATIIFTLSYFGINASTKKYIAQYNGKKELKNIIIESLKLRFIFSVVFTIGFILIYPFFIDIINKPELNKLFLYFIPLILLSGFVEFFKEVFIGLHRIKYNFIINFLEYGLKLLLIIFFFLFSDNLINIVNSFLISLAITTLVGFYLLYFNFYKPLKQYSEQNFLRDILKYSFPLFFISIGFLLTTEIDIIMILILTDEEQVGIYSIAKQFIIKFPQISLAIAMGSMQIFTTLNKNNKNDLKKVLFNILKINSYIFFPIGIITFFGSYFFVPILFGQEYIKSIIIFQILTPYMIMVSFSIYIVNILDYQGLAKKRAINLSISMILNIILNFFLIQKYGASGAAFATLISVIPYFILNYFEVKKLFISLK